MLAYELKTRDPERQSAILIPSEVPPPKLTLPERGLLIFGQRGKEDASDRVAGFQKMDRGIQDEEEDRIVAIQGKTTAVLRVSFELKGAAVVPNIDQLSTAYTNAKTRLPTGGREKLMCFTLPSGIISRICWVKDAVLGTFSGSTELEIKEYIHLPDRIEWRTLSDEKVELISDAANESQWVIKETEGAERNEAFLYLGMALHPTRLILAANNGRSMRRLFGVDPVRLTNSEIEGLKRKVPEGLLAFSIQVRDLNERTKRRTTRMHDLRGLKDVDAGQTA